MLPPAWDDRAIGRFAFRLAVLRRHGVDPRRAERIADQLAHRDALRDDRRMCFECVHLQRGTASRAGACAAARRGDLAEPCDPYLTPVPDVLQRCSGFEFVKPA